MADDNSDSKITLSRRKALAGIAGIGAASAVGGFGTQALFSDAESVSGTFTAGELDLKIGWEVSHYGNNVNPDTVAPLDTDGPNSAEGLGINLEDVKPGDSGWIRFRIQNVGNPAWVWFRGRLKNSMENGQTDAEIAAEGQDTDGFGELDENLEFRSFYDQNENATVGDDGPFNSMNEPNSIWNDRYIQKPLDLKAQQNQGQYGSTPVLLDGVRDANSPDISGGTAYPDGEPIDPFGNMHDQYITVRWGLPLSVGNQVQSDKITVCFDFYSEQSRHNPEGRFRGTDSNGDTNVNTNKANGDYPENPWASEYSGMPVDFTNESSSTNGLVLGPHPDNGAPDSSA